ncbi:MAG TPA: PHB depolymerase family esterase [Drouetiella sp.]
MENFIAGDKQTLRAGPQGLFESVYGILGAQTNRTQTVFSQQPHIEQNPLITGQNHPHVSAGDNFYTTTIDGNIRHFSVHVPPNYDGTKPIPVVMMMPGMGGSIDQMRHETGMNRAADQRGFAVVYTEALPKPFPGSLGYSKANSWNLAHGSLTERTTGYDDLNYIKQVSNVVSRELNTDNAARYIVGFSEGGSAAQFIAESMPGTFAGVGSVHGTRLASDLKPKYGDKTAFVAVLGDDDNMLPLRGGHGWFDGGLLKGFTTITMPKVQQSEPLSQKSNWAQADGCGMPIVTDNGKDKKTEFFCPGTHVTEIIRHKGQHAWDGLGQNPRNYITHKPDFGWSFIGEPDPTEDTTRDVLNALLPYRKDGKFVKMQRNLLEQ